MEAPVSDLQTLAGLVTEDGSAWGVRATAWQRADAAAFLNLDGPRLHYWTRARGGSKTSDAAALAVVGLLSAPPRSRSYCFAADRDQAALLHDAAAGLIERSGLGGLVEVETHRLVVRSTGASLSVESSDDASAWGLRPYVVLVDELSAWSDVRRPRRLWDAIVSSLPKRADSRLLVVCSAGDPAHWSMAVLESARGSQRWRVSETAGPVPWLDPADLDEQRRLLTDSQFRRLILNQWTTGEDRLATLDAIRACVTLDGPQDPVPGRRYLVTVDLGLVRDRTVVAVCHRYGAVVILDRMLVLQGSKARPVSLQAVEDALVEVSERFARPRLVCDPWQATGLVQRLRARGLRVQEWPFTAQSVGRLGTALHLAIRDQRLAIPPDDALVDELASVRLRETPSGVRLDHDAGRHDDRAVALALAVHELTRTEPSRMTISVPRGSIEEYGRRPPAIAETRRRIREPDELRAARAGLRRTDSRSGLPPGVADRLAAHERRRR
jgi:phage terminase large subunit-like protein